MSPPLRQKISTALHERRNALFFEPDGDFNPMWFLVICFHLIGAGCAVVSFVSENTVVRVAALSFLASVIIVDLIAVLPIAKAKVLAQARSPGSVSRGISSAAKFGGSTEPWDDDEPFDYR